MDKIRKIIFSAMENLNQELEDKLEIHDNAVLYGAKSPIDSLALVSLIIDIEQGLEEEFGVTIALADERAMSLKKSPFRTVKSLDEYIQIRLEEENG